jgi:hypothetical protein
MPMELYSSEAFVRDIVNAISKSEGKPVNIGGADHADIDRAYVFQLINEAKQAVEGHVPPQKRMQVVRRLPVQARKAIAAQKVKAAPKKRVAVRASRKA